MSNEQHVATLREMLGRFNRSVHNVNETGRHCERVRTEIAALDYALALAEGASEAVLDAPARVGNTRFSEGVKWSTVIGCAQRLYAHTPPSDKELEGMKAAFAKVMESITPTPPTSLQGNHAPTPSSEPTSDYGIAAPGHTAQMTYATPDSPHGEEVTAPRGVPAGWDAFEAYKTWPADVRAKLSCHDLRRMNIVSPAAPQDGGGVSEALKSLRCVKSMLHDIDDTGDGPHTAAKHTYCVGVSRKAIRELEALQKALGAGGAE